VHVLPLSQHSTACVDLCGSQGFDSLEFTDTKPVEGSNVYLEVYVCVAFVTAHRLVLFAVVKALIAQGICAACVTAQHRLVSLQGSQALKCMPQPCLCCLTAWKGTIYFIAP